MLVLSRKNDQSVVVGGVDGLERLVKVTVLEIGHAIVRLGFEADADVPVHREEVWQRIRSGGRRDPPTFGGDGIGSCKEDGKASALSGAGQGRSPNATRDSV